MKHMYSHLLALLPMLWLALLPLTGAAQILPGTLSGGSQHSALLLPGGGLRTWGDNAKGQLGDGTTTPRTAPVPAGPATTYAQVASGGNHTLGLRADGTLWAWGDNAKGQLGDGTTTNRTAPTQVGAATRWKQVAAGYEYSVALAADGTLWAWGSNASSQLGDGTFTNRTVPTQVGGAATTWLSVACGDIHTLAVRADGTLWAWGYNGSGRLGDGTTINRGVPTQVGTATTWLSAEGGGGFSLGLRADGTLWAWGNNQFGQLGDGTTTQRTAPVQVGSSRLWRQVAGRYSGSAAIAADGTLWAWGSNPNGQLGDGTTTQRNVPTQVGTATTWASVSPGDEHTLALQADGSVWSWGSNANGQLGDGTTTSRSTPALVPGVGGLATRSLSAGLRHSAGIDPRGNMRTWGSGGNGRLGNGSTASALTPYQVGTTTSWVQCTTGSGSFSLALAADGTLWAWGYNADGQLGIGTTGGNRGTPVQVGPTRQWRQIWSGVDHSLALAADGSLWAWGYNADGQLGQGDLVLRNAPTAVAPGTVWRSIGGGNNHSLAITADGTLYAWGQNNAGQLGIGNGNTTSATSPTAVAGGGRWLAVDGGFSFSIGLQATGVVYTWGNNGSGQLGDGTNTLRTTPGALTSAVPYTQVAAGSFHSLGLRADGTLWGWGLNSNGQLGDGTTTLRTAPVQEATGGTAWLALSGGGAHSLARTAYGPNFFSTGDNTFGQLGDGTTTQSLVYTRTGNTDGQPLPVELTRFTATAAGPATVRLAWATASEKNSARFEVERSLDGMTFTTIGTVTAAVHSSSGRSYELLDAKLPASAARLYYRLKQVDTDGTFSNSPVRVVALMGAAQELALYPNPTRSGAATLTGTIPSAVVTVSDALGRPVATATADAAGTAALALPAGLPVGVYVVRVRSKALRLTVE
jgi:alpha-tubulin suppressor-like RCC1 family protein